MLFLKKIRENKLYIKSIVDINSLNLNGLVEIPNLKEFFENDNVKSEIITDEKSDIKKAFRKLRLNLQFLTVTLKNKKVILVTSPVKGEGKSFITANTAITFAELGKKVIIIDADMIFGRQSQIFNIPNELGLSNYLSGLDTNGAEINELTNRFIKETSFKNVNVITSGSVPPNPSDLLKTEKFSELLKELGVFYDFIIIDGTSFLENEEAIVLTKEANSIVLTVNYGKAKIIELKKVKEHIEKLEGKIVGVIINKVKVKKNPKSKEERKKELYLFKEKLKSKIAYLKICISEKLISHKAKLLIEGLEEDPIFEKYRDEVNLQENMNIEEKENTINVSESEDSNIIEPKKVNKSYTNIEVDNDKNDIKEYNEDTNLNKVDINLEYINNKNHIVSLTNENSSNLKNTSEEYNLNSVNEVATNSKELENNKEKKALYKENNYNKKLQNNNKEKSLHVKENISNEKLKNIVTNNNLSSENKVYEEDKPIDDVNVEDNKNTNVEHNVNRERGLVNKVKSIVTSLVIGSDEVLEKINIEDLNIIKEENNIDAQETNKINDKKYNSKVHEVKEESNEQGKNDLGIIDDTINENIIESLKNNCSKISNKIRENSLKLVAIWNAKLSKNKDNAIDTNCLNNSNDKIGTQKNKTMKNNFENNQNLKMNCRHEIEEEYSENSVLLVVDAENGFCRAFSKYCFIERLIRDNLLYFNSYYSNSCIRSVIIDLSLKYKLTKNQVKRIDPLVYSTLCDYDSYVWFEKKIFSNKAEIYVRVMAEEYEQKAEETKKQYELRCQRMRKQLLEKSELEIEYKLDNLFSSRILSITDKLILKKYANLYDIDNKLKNDFEIKKSEENQKLYDEIVQVAEQELNYTPADDNKKIEDIKKKLEESRINIEKYKKKAEEQRMKQVKKAEVEIQKAKIKKEQEVKRKAKKEEKAVKKEERQKKREEEKKQRELERELQKEEARVEEELLGDNLYPKTKNNKFL